MPRPAQIAPSPWLAPTKQDLARRLGLGRNTPTVWQGEGAPAELCELQWRTWAAAHGRQVGPCADDGLRARLAAAGVRGYEAPAAAPAAPEDPLAISRELERDPKAFGQYLANKDRLIDLERKAGELIALRSAEAAVAVVARLFARQLDRLPALVAEIAPSPEEATRYQAYVAERVARWRTDLAAQVETALRELRQ